MFDITDFSALHPGGEHLIRLAAGRDALCLLESYHPLPAIAKVREALATKTMYVGELQLPPLAGSGSELLDSTTQTYDDTFFRDVRARVYDFIHGPLQGDRYAYETIGQIEALCTLVLYLLGTYFVAVAGSWCWVVVLGLSMGRMGFFMHSGLHGAISKDPKRNHIIGRFHDLIGSNYLVWGFEHQGEWLSVSCCISTYEGSSSGCEMSLMLCIARNLVLPCSSAFVCIALMHQSHITSVRTNTNLTMTAR